MGQKEAAQAEDEKTGIVQIEKHITDQKKEKSGCQKDSHRAPFDNQGEYQQRCNRNTLDKITERIRVQGNIQNDKNQSETDIKRKDKTFKPVLFLHIQQTRPGLPDYQVRTRFQFRNISSKAFHTAIPLLIFSARFEGGRLRIRN